MPHATHPAQPRAPLSCTPLIHDAWTTEVVPRLPTNLDHAARTYGALQRTRKLACASDMLRGLLAYVLCAPSFRMLGAWAVVIGLADLSEVAWRKRLRAANTWLLWILTELCAAPSTTRGPARPADRRVLLIDATVLGTPGGTGADWRVHTAYDFTAGHLQQVVVADRQSAEHLAHYALQSGDIVVADGGYGHRRNGAIARQQQADVVLRITYQNFPLEWTNGTAVDLVAWVQASRTPPLLQREVWCRYQHARYAVRVVALRVSAEAARRAQARVRRKSGKKGYCPRAVTLAMCHWVFLVTTLDEDAWPSEAIAHLYRARWQIELLFKQMKSLLQLNDLRVTCPVAVEAVVRLKLIAWLLQADGAAAVRSCLAQVHTHQLSAPHVRTLSSWRMTTLSLTTLRQQVLGRWSAVQVQACLHRLHRYLYDSPRMRRHHETHLRRWLAAYGA